MPAKTTKKARGRPATGRGRGALATRNGDFDTNNNLLKELEVFRESLEEQIRRITEQRDEELRLLDVQEEEFFQRECNLFSAEQLDLSGAQLDKFLAEKKAEEDKQSAKVKLPTGPPAAEQHDGVEDVPVVFRIPVVKPVPKKKRRSSVIQPYSSVAATPVWRASRGPKLPKFMTTGTGIKNMEPRVAGLGEITYSDNGSPVVSVTAAKPKAQPRKGKMALASLNLDV